MDTHPATPENQTSRIGGTDTETAPIIDQTSKRIQAEPKLQQPIK
jgi:hypothetical protein